MVTNNLETGPIATAKIDSDILKSASQRRVNILWEVTQAIIAITFAVSYTWAELSKIDSPGLANATFLIVGFYFSRTNHQRVGGVGGEAAGTR